MNIKPLNDRILLKRIQENITQGGIVIPETAGDKPQQGEVMAVGPGKIENDGKRRQLDVKVGDRVLFGKYSGTEVKVNGQDFLVMREEDIIGIVA